MKSVSDLTRSISACSASIMSVFRLIPRPLAIKSAFFARSSGIRTVVVLFDTTPWYHDCVISAPSGVLSDLIDSQLELHCLACWPPSVSGHELLGIRHRRGCDDEGVWQAQ